MPKGSSTLRCRLVYEIKKISTLSVTFMVEKGRALFNQGRKGQTFKMSLIPGRPLFLSILDLELDGSKLLGQNFLV